MPLCFRIAVEKSPISGKGLIALEDIPQGATYWTFQDEGNVVIPENCPDYNENLLLTQDDFKKITDKEKMQKLLHESFFYEPSNQAVFLRDGTEMMNHSEDHNSLTIFDKNGDPRKMRAVAKRLIKAGEEITDNYNCWHPSNTRSTWFAELLQKYSPQNFAFYNSIKSQSTIYSKRN